MATETIPIFTPSEIMLAALLGKTFRPESVLDIIRSLSDLGITEHPYDAVCVEKVHERLQWYGYNANEANQVVWALRERAK